MFNYYDVPLADKFLLLGSVPSITFWMHNAIFLQSLHTRAQLKNRSTHTCCRRILNLLPNKRLVSNIKGRYSVVINCDVVQTFRSHLKFTDLWQFSFSNKSHIVKHGSCNYLRCGVLRWLEQEGAALCKTTDRHPASCRHHANGQCVTRGRDQQKSVRDEDQTSWMMKYRNSKNMV